MNFRFIPVLTLADRGLIKTVKFSSRKYIGDPINAVRIFNDKGVDELIFLDIFASKLKKKVEFAIIEEIANEAFMPFAFGGGINNVTDAKSLLRLGVEKIVINSICYSDELFIRKLSDNIGSQSVIVSIDVKRNIFNNYELKSISGEKRETLSLEKHLERAQELGAGEIMITSINKDGTMSGMDMDLIKRVSSLTSVPIIVCGGVGTIEDVQCVLEEVKVSAVAAGSVFVYQGINKGVLINYPDEAEIEKLKKVRYDNL